MTGLAICSHCILSICNIYLFPALVLRAGFAFCLLQFLFIAFLLLLSMVREKVRGKIIFQGQDIVRKLCNSKGNFRIKLKVREKSWNFERTSQGKVREFRNVR